MDGKKVIVLISGTGTGKSWHLIYAETKADVTDANLNKAVIGNDYTKVVQMGSLIFTSSGERGIFKSDSSINWL